MYRSVNGCVLSVVGGVIVVVIFLLAINLMHNYTQTRLVNVSFLVTEQASSSKNITDKEISFVSLNGNLVNDNKPKATTQLTIINATTVTVLKPKTTTTESAGLVKRGKRYLDFLNTSRMFFRVNAKNNILPNSFIWAHGYGFRCNFPIENNKMVRLYRRDTYEILGDLMDKSGFDGKACILKAFCTAHIDQNVNMQKGILFKLLKYLFTLKDNEKRHFSYLKHENCQQILHSHCPLSFNNISPFTDDV